MFVGNIISILTIIPQSDNKGRRFSIIASRIFSIISVVFTILGIYLKDWIFICIAQVFGGIYISGVTILSYVITG
jgi:hypothetical protein